MEEGIYTNNYIKKLKINSNIFFNNKIITYDKEYSNRYESNCY
uniref:Uncharacterized protein n=1 Tax=viral metagenome TaxID=1070528 RepID=A0A6C0DJ02_9ZZZZ